MQTVYALSRSTLLVIVAVLSMVLSFTINEIGFFFAVSLLIGAALTFIYLFLHFDEQINDKIIMEALIDAFAGLVILTYPEISQRFVLSSFAFWMAMNGILYLTNGVIKHKKTSFFWIYILIGLMMIIFGFTIINYNAEHFNSVTYLMIFSLLIYGFTSTYLSFARKTIPFQ